MIKLRFPLVALLFWLIAGLLTFLVAKSLIALPPDIAVAARWLALALTAAAVAPRRSLTLWIVISMLVGIELGHDAPGVAVHLKVLSDAFLRLVKTIIAPLVFCHSGSGYCRPRQPKAGGSYGPQSSGVL